MAEISVIVPIYNAEEFLHRCVDSILDQTFTDFDLILVNDGSKDGSLLICNEYEQKDSRVHVIHQENRGPSAARNSGIEYAVAQSDSRYITFVDSDDYLHPQFLEYMFRAVEIHAAEIGMCCHQYMSLNEKLRNIDLYERCIDNEREAEELMIANSSGFNYIWGKLYAKYLFRTVRYPENISFGEDNLITFKIMFECNKIVFLENTLYYYFYTSTGITKSLWTPSSLDVFDGIRVQIDYYAKNGYQKAYQKEVELYIQQYAYQIHRIYANREVLKENQQHLQNMKRGMKQILKENPEYHVRERFYWFEALYPKRARLLNLLGKIKRSLWNENKIDKNF